jgi:hypothetical protein
MLSTKAIRSIVILLVAIAVTKVVWDAYSQHGKPNIKVVTNTWGRFRDVLLENKMDILLETSTAYSVTSPTPSSTESWNFTVPQNVSTEETTPAFAVGDSGFWIGVGATQKHMFDTPLSLSIASFFKNESVKSVLELGAGTGEYAKVIKVNDMLSGNETVSHYPKK